MSKKLGVEHAGYEDAIGRERREKARLIVGLVEAVRPALRALSSRIKSSEASEWSPGEHAHVVVRKAYFAGAHGRGILVSEGPPGPSRNPPRAPRGVYSGTDLFLTEAGEFVDVQYTGTFDEKGTCFWSAEAIPQTPDDIAAEWLTSEIVDRLNLALEQQLGGSLVPRTREISERAEKLRALSTLLGFLDVDGARRVR